jgi:hypothetical protein
MKWSEEKVQQLRDLAFAGKSNKEIAETIGVGINDVYAQRSHLGITIDKVKATKAASTAPTADIATVPPPFIPHKRSTAEITHDLRIQLRALSAAFDESHFLIVELLDVLGLLDSTSQ